MIAAKVLETHQALGRTAVIGASIKDGRAPYRNHVYRVSRGEQCGIGLIRVDVKLRDKCVAHPAQNPVKHDASVTFSLHHNQVLVMNAEFRCISWVQVQMPVGKYNPFLHLKNSGGTNHLNAWRSIDIPGISNHWHNA